MKTLNLTLKKKWFDMILSGEKTTEYREVKQYWIDRIGDATKIINFDTVTFINGYGDSRPRIVLKLKSITMGTGKKEWGAEPNTYYFCIDLGEIIETRNIK